MWLRQRDGVTCGPSVAVMAGALLDAQYGAPLQDGRAQQWFNSEQGRMHRTINTVWPRALGTTPAGMARALSVHGTRYRWRPAARGLDDVCAAVARGWPVAMLIGSVIPRHWVLLTELCGTALRCYEPSSGQLIEVQADDIGAARLKNLGFPRPFAFVLPTGWALEYPVGEPKLPPSPRVARPLVALSFVASRRRSIERLTRRIGRAVTVRVPVFGDAVVISDPALAKQVFTTSPEVLYNIQPNLSRLLGRGSVFALDGADHRRRRKLLTPPFHGKSIKAYELIVEEETMREMATWPEGREFATLEPMMRITLNVILRAVFGAEGAELQQFRQLLPKWVTLGSRLAVLPTPSRSFGRWSPWARLAGYRRTYEGLIDNLIDRARRDPHLEDRTDILSLFLRSTYDDGAAMTREEIGDELLTLLAAGHETTASTLGWAFERISRHPEVLAKLVREAEAGDDNTYRQATILELQRVRTVIDFAGRHVMAPMYELGDYRIPQGFSIMVSLLQLHQNPNEFPNPERFDPQRFIDGKPNTFAWVPFGGGTRRCVGAAFANMEMDVVLRTVLRHVTIRTTDAPGEKWHSRGVAFTPKEGGRVVVYRRAAPV